MIKTLRKYKIIPFIFLTLLLAGCNKYSTPQTLDGIYFDTYVVITTYDTKDVAAMYKAIDMCEVYEKEFSPTLEESETYKINNRLLENISTDEGNYTCYISDDMYNVLSESIEYCKQTSNSFNPLLGSVTSLWDFHGNSEHVPSASDIESALSHTDINSIILSPDSHTLTITDPTLKLDLGAVVKGYAADNIAEMMRDNECTDAIIALGGNIYCIGTKGNKGYNVGIQKPFAQNGEYIQTLSIGNSSVVTSGIYERYFQKEQKLYHHIINPLTGYPVDNDIASVTVIGKSSLQCDILSTAILVMGKEKGLEYAKSLDDINVIIIDKDDNIITE